jgi:hypothetical protein
MRRELLLGIGLVCGCAHFQEFQNSPSPTVLESDSHGDYVLVQNGPYCSVRYEDNRDFRGNDLLYWQSAMGDMATIIRLTNEHCREE